MNLLRNPGFERGLALGENTHRILVLPPEPENVPQYRDVLNIDNPRDWTVWFRHEPGTWDQPEGHLTPEALRIQAGEWAYHLFAFFRKMDAGLFQRVFIDRPMQLEFRAGAYAWSNEKDRPHTDDPLWSEGPGFGAGYCLLLDAPNDDWRNVAFAGGIDTTGGIDPRAGSVRWGWPANIYNEYHQIPEVIVDVEPGWITVFVAVQTLWPFKHNDAYFDSVSLTEFEGSPRGEPRVQYPRTYVLLAPDATLDEAHKALDDHFEYRRTIGFSADDAGIGNLDERNVLAVRADAWPDDLGEFFEEHYPGVNYQPIEEPEPDLEILLWQADPRWRDVRYAEGRCYTIGAKGCWITDCAMAQRYFGIDPEATPLTVDAIVGDVGYTDGCEMRWDAMPALGLEVVDNTIDLDRVELWLDDGSVCFAEVLPISLQHFVMVTRHGWLLGEPLDQYWMLDPAKNIEGWLSKHYAGVESWRLVRPNQEPEPPEPPQPPTLHVEPISFHIQSWQERDYLDAFIAEVKPAVVKLVEGMEQAYRIKELSPETLVVYRHVTSHQGAFVQHPDGPNAGARAGITEFKDSLLKHAAVIDYIETPANEQIATDDLLGIDECVAFDVAFCEELQNIGLPARPVILTAGVGNPQHGAQVERLIPAVRAAVAADGALGYHTYWGNNYQTGRCTMTDGDWKHYAGRALESWDPVFRVHGLFPKYIFGEGGPIGIAATGNVMNYLAGWRHPDCLNGDRDILMRQILEFRRRINLWNEEHNHRVLGFTLFTVFGFDWDWFQYRKEEMDALRQILA